MSTFIHIPGYLINDNQSFDINDFLTTPPQNFTIGPNGRTRSTAEWVIEIVDDLTVGQQNALSTQLLNALDQITFEVIP